MMDILFNLDVDYLRLFKKEKSLIPYYKYPTEQSQECREGKFIINLSLSFLKRLCWILGEKNKKTTTEVKYDMLLPSQTRPPK